MQIRKTNKELQEIFKEGNFIARALYLPNMQDIRAKDKEFGYDMKTLHDEVKFLNQKKLDGNHDNVERNGQRNRSATMLVPDVDMDLLFNVGLVYDGDKSTIRGYMYYDSMTSSGLKHDGFYNLKDDKNKLEPITSKNDFIKKYTEYRKRTDNTNMRATSYNEVLANFFPESLVALVGADDSNQTKLKLLTAKHIMNEHYQYDLPMTIMENGKIKAFEPSFEEIAKLLNTQSADIEKFVKRNPNKIKEEVLNNFAGAIGFDLKIKNSSKEISASDLSLKNKNTASVDEVTDYLSKITGMQKGSRFSYGVEGRLTEVINIRRKKDLLPKIADTKKHIVQQIDIKNLVNLLDKELETKNINHQCLKEPDINSLSSEILQNISQTRGNQLSKTEHHKPKWSERINSKLQNPTLGKVSKLREFMNKVKSIFTENIISKSVAEHTPRKNSNRGISR